MSLTNQ